MARDEATQKLAEWIKQMGNHDVQVYHARGSKILGKEAEVIIDEANACKRGEERAMTKNEPKHDRGWIIGCIKHDGFIKTDRGDKANQIILEALQAEPKTKCIARIEIDPEEVVKRIKEEYDITDVWIPCSERLPKEYAQYLVCFEDGECYVYWLEDSDWARGMVEKEGIIAWMPLPKPYGEDDEA